MERKIIVIKVLVMVAIIAGILLPGHIRLKRLREDNERYKKRIEILREHNEDLKKELALTRDDPDHTEKVAREKLGIVKKGEIIYRGRQ